MTTTIDQINEPLRGADLPTLLDRLSAQRQMRYDLVAPSDALDVDRVDGTFRVWTPEGGVLPVALDRRAVGSLCSRTPITVNYWDQMAECPSPELLARTVNWWTGRSGDHPTSPWLFRIFQSQDPSLPSLLRCVLSDRYRPLENLDVMQAVASAVPPGADVSADLAAHRMRVRITVPTIGVDARHVLRDYRSPYTGRTGEDLPLMFSGLDISNGETGGAAFTVAPRAVFQVCNNGMTQSVDVERAVHLGGVLDEGTIQWSAETQEAQLRLLTSKTRDAVARFLSTEYLDEVLDRIAGAAQVPVGVTAARQVALGLFPEATTDSILDLFARSGDLTQLGLGQAVTAHAQRVDDIDQAHDIESAFWKVIDQRALSAVS